MFLDDNSIIDKTLNITSEEVLSGVHNQTGSLVNKASNPKNSFLNL